MRDEQRPLFDYIDAEVMAVCEEKGWGSQVRRKWSARERPVSESPVGDYEWKLIPGATRRLGDAGPNDFDGEYYVVSFKPDALCFELLHDTHNVGPWGPHWELAHFTQIAPPLEVAVLLGGPAPKPPRVGWLRTHLANLVQHHGPNSFSRT